MSNTVRYSSRAALFGLLVLLTACSSFKTLYNQLDWILPWYLDDYISLNEDQKGPFNQQLESFIQWHRQQQLPQYADFMERLAASAEDGLDELEIESIYRELRLLTDQMVEGLVIQFIDLIETMDEQQYRRLFENLDQKNLQFKTKYIDTKELIQRDKRAQRKLELFEKWTGSVTEKQKQIVERWSEEYLLMGEAYLESQHAWQQRLKQILLKRDEDNFLQPALLTLVEQRRNLRSKTFNDKIVFNDKLDKQLYQELDRSLYSQQRAFLVKKLRSIASDFRELAAQDS
jgi:hypothetical protein